MIRVGLVGFGLAGRVFHAPLISSVDGLELAAVVERSADTAAERYPGITTHRSVDGLLADSSLDLVVVASPNATHFEVASHALHAGKHVVVDKPAAVHASEIADLMRLAKSRGKHLIPFHNRRWDSDFRTLTKLLHEGCTGRVIHLHSNFDRWSPGSTRRPWKNDPAEGGILLDLGTHLVDQALVLFGKPDGVSAEVLREREGEGSNDSFTLRLRYPEHMVTLSSNLLSALARPRFHLRGGKGNYWKWGVDSQEAELAKVRSIGGKSWGMEPASDWGTVKVDVEGGMVTRPLEPVPGDYRLFYAGVRDAIVDHAEPPVSARSAWQVARVLEWASESSRLRCEAGCDWSEEPA